MHLMGRRFTVAVFSTSPVHLTKNHTIHFLLRFRQILGITVMKTVISIRTFTKRTCTVPKYYSLITRKLELKT